MVDWRWGQSFSQSLRKAADQAGSKPPTAVLHFIQHSYGPHTPHEAPLLRAGVKGPEVSCARQPHGFRLWLVVLGLCGRFHHGRRGSPERWRPSPPLLPLPMRVLLLLLVVVVD